MLALLALSLAALASGPAPDVGSAGRSILLVNATGYELTGLAAAPLANGGTLRLTLSGPCSGDLAALWSGSRAPLVWHGLAFCGVHEIRLGYDEETGETTAYSR